MLGNVALLKLADSDEAVSTEALSDAERKLLQAGTNVTDFQIVFVCGLHWNRRTLKVPIKIYFNSAVVRSGRCASQAQVDLLNRAPPCFLLAGQVRIPA